MDTLCSASPQASEPAAAGSRFTLTSAPQTGAPEHFVEFYEDDAFLLDTLADYAGEALRSGDAAIVIATPEHRDGLAARVRARSIDIAGAMRAGHYIPLDAAQTLARFVADGMPDRALFREVIGSLLLSAGAGKRHVRAYGEMVALLTAAGNAAAAIALEELWNEMQRLQPFSLFCAYPLHILRGAASAPLLSKICDTHTRVIPAESYTTLTDAARLREIAALQQKAASLEVEVARRRQAEEQLEAALAQERAAREQAEAALRLRDEFLTIAAHELKTPLTSLIVQAQLVLRRIRHDGAADRDQVLHTLDGIGNQAARLARLLGHLVDISRLEAGRLRLERERTNLRAIAEQVITGAQFRSPHHPISISGPDTVEAEVDPFRLEQVLVNLLDNAIKYSPEGGAIEVSLVQSGPGTVELSVRDHGIGIPAGKQPRIFERFFQAHGESHRSGFGLGLYISREVVQLHGGTIAAEFPEDGGTRFVVRLPASPGTEMPGSMANSAEAVE